MKKIKNNSKPSLPKGNVITMTYPEIADQFEKISMLYLESYKHREKSILNFLNDEEEPVGSKNEPGGEDLIVIYRRERLKQENPSDN